MIRYKVSRLFDDLKGRYQRAKRGFSYSDCYNINYWFSHEFVGMLLCLRDNAIGYPFNVKERTNISDFPKDWVKAHIPIIERLLQDKGNSDRFDANNDYHMWLLILTRLAYCFKQLDEDAYDCPYKVGDPEFISWWDKTSEEMLEYKKEAYRLLEKYHYDLWD